MIHTTQNPNLLKKKKEMSIFNSNFTNKNNFNPIQKQNQKLWNCGNLALTRISWGKASRRDLSESKPNLSPHIFFDGVFRAKSIAKPWKWFEIKILFLLNALAYLTYPNPSSSSPTTRFDFKELPHLFPNAIFFKKKSVSKNKSVFESKFWK